MSRLLVLVLSGATIFFATILADPARALPFWGWALGAVAAFGLPWGLVTAARDGRGDLLGVLLGIVATTSVLLAMFASDPAVAAEVRLAFGIVVGTLLGAVLLAAFRAGASAGTALPGLAAAVLAGSVAAAALGLLPEFKPSAQEDGWIEWATFAAFLAAGLGALVRRSATSRLDAALWILLGLGALFVAGEEVSWGQRIVGFEPPEAFLARNLQQEANLHNFVRPGLELGLPLGTRFLLAYAAVFGGVLLPLAARASRAVALPTAVSFDPRLAPAFAAVAFLELVYPLPFTGEAAELLLGLAVLAVVVVGARRGRVEPSEIGGLGALALMFPVGVGVALAAGMGSVATDPRLLGVAERELATLRADLLRPGAVIGNLGDWPRLHERLYTAAKRGHVRFGFDSAFLEKRATPAEVPEGGPARRDRRGYLLDPWSTPYWVDFHRDAGVLLVYSMGPNRRRDTKLERLSREDLRAARLGGDDLGVAIGVRVVPEQG